MSVYFHLRAVPPPALRNSAPWLQRLFEDDWVAVRERIGRHREEVLDKGYLDYEHLYTGTLPDHPREDPRADVVLGGRPVSPSDRGLPPFLLLTAAQVTRVATFLASSDFDDLWRRARDELLPEYGGAGLEPQARGVRGDAPGPDRVLRPDRAVR
jgi:hypothetical protein